MTGPQLKAALDQGRLTGATLVIAKLDRLNRNVAFLATDDSNDVQFVAVDTLPDADRSIADALALARLLRRLPGGEPHPFGSATATAATLTALGGSPMTGW